MKTLMQSIQKYWPELLIMIICGVLLGIGISEKKGYHMDELLSFELSNAEFTPWIVPTQPQGRLEKFVLNEIRGENFADEVKKIGQTVKDVLKNRGNSKLLSYQADVYPEPVWIDKEAFREYVTVNREDDFNYLSVYFNVKDDNHPPLHFMLLHTVSSVIQNRISPVMGCAINLACVLGILLLLMKLGRQIMVLIGAGQYGRVAGDGAALLYGISAGALSTTLLIRMYALLTFFCVLLLEIHLKKIYASALHAEDFSKKNKLLILVTVLGFWTQYFFLFYCLTLAAVTVLLLLKQKRTKECLRYITRMMMAAVIGIIFFPFAISDVFASGRGVEALGNLTKGFSGMGIRLTAFGRILGEASGMLCVLVLVLICLGWGVLSKEKKKREMWIWTVLIVPVLAYDLLAAKMSPFLVDRYVMPVFPLVMLGLVTGAVGVLAKVFADREKTGLRCTAVILGFLTAIQLLLPMRWQNVYYYKEYADQEAVAEAYEEIPCICIYEGVRYYENLPEFMHYEKTLLVTMEELKERQERESFEEIDETAVLLKKKIWRPEAEEALKEYGFSPVKVLFSSKEEDGDEIILFGRDR